LIAVLLLLLGGGLRLWQIGSLPAGLHAGEITEIRITEGVRQGNIEVFYDLGTEGRESLFHITQAAVTSVFGNGLLGYHLLGTWVGLVTLALVYALASRLYGPLAGVMALAILTLNMWHILLGRHVERETLLPLIVVGMLLTLARTMGVYRDVHPRLPLNTAFALLGVLLGLGFYLHPAHFMIVLFSMAFIALKLVSRNRPSRQTIGYLLFSVLIMMIVAMPYLISSIRLPNLAGAARLFGDYTVAQKSPFEALVDGIGGLLFVGDADPVHNLPGRPLIDLVSGLIVAVGVLTAARGWRFARYALPLIATIILIPISFLTVEGVNFLNYAPLLPLVALFFGLGIVTLYQSFTTSARPAVVLGFAALLAFNLVWTTRDLFQVWPELDAVQAAYSTRSARIAAYLDRTAADLPTVICDSSLAQRTREQLSNTDLVLLMMNRKDVHLRFADCGTGMIFVNGGAAQQVVLPDADTLVMMRPELREWLALGTLVDEQGVPAGSVVQVEVAQALADRVGLFTTMSPAGFAPEAGSGLAVPPLRFGGNITFLGHEPLSAAPYAPNSILTSITYWRVDGMIPPDLRFFTHVLADPAVCCAAQNDTISVDVTQLSDRDVFVQIVFVPLPASLPAETYSVSVGAYLNSSGTRMGVMDGEQQRGTRLFLGQIQVTG
jgi:hypothetical protein